MSLASRASHFLIGLSDFDSEARLLRSYVVRQALSDLTKPTTAFTTRVTTALKSEVLSLLWRMIREDSTWKNEPSLRGALLKEAFLPGRLLRNSESRGRGAIGRVAVVAAAGALFFWVLLFVLLRQAGGATLEFSLPTVFAIASAALLAVALSLCVRPLTLHLWFGLGVAAELAWTSIASIGSAFVVLIVFHAMEASEYPAPSVLESGLALMGAAIGARSGAWLGLPFQGSRLQLVVSVCGALFLSLIVSSVLALVLDGRGNPGLPKAWFIAILSGAGLALVTAYWESKGPKPLHRPGKLLLYTAAAIVLGLLVVAIYPVVRLMGTRAPAPLAVAYANGPREEHLLAVPTLPYNVRLNLQSQLTLAVELLGDESLGDPIVRVKQIVTQALVMQAPTAQGQPTRTIISWDDPERGCVDLPPGGYVIEINNLSGLAASRRGLDSASLFTLIRSPQRFSDITRLGTLKLVLGTNSELIRKEPTCRDQDRVSSRFSEIESFELRIGQIRRGSRVYVRPPADRMESPTWVSEMDGLADKPLIVEKLVRNRNDVVIYVQGSQFQLNARWLVKVEPTATQEPAPPSLKATRK